MAADDLIPVPGRNVSISKTGSNLSLGTTADPHTTPDWNETDSSQPAYIANKPTFEAITTAEINSLFN